MSDLPTALQDLAAKLASLQTVRTQLSNLAASEPTYPATLAADAVAEDAFVKARVAVLIEIAAAAANVVRAQGLIANKAAQVLQSLSGSSAVDGRLYAVSDAAQQHILDLSQGVDLADFDATAIDAATRDFIVNGGLLDVPAKLYDAIGVAPPTPAPAAAQAEQVPA